MRLRRQECIGAKDRFEDALEVLLKDDPVLLFARAAKIGSGEIAQV
jgi:hypothetical protein